MCQFKAIPKYCTAHPVLRIINVIGNIIWRLSLPESLHARKMAFLERYGWEKRGGNLRQRRKRKLSESVEIIKSAKTSVLSFSNVAEYSQTRGNLKSCDGPFLLNEHRDLYFLLHKNIVHIILLN